jgi:hypothetical protein
LPTLEPLARDVESAKESNAMTVLAGERLAKNEDKFGLRRQADKALAARPFSR